MDTDATPNTVTESVAGTGEPGDYSALLEQMISGLESNPEVAPDANTEPAAVPEPVAAVPAAEPVVAAEPAKVDAKPADPALERSWAALAKREQEIADARNSIEAERRKLTNLTSQFRRDPLAALKELGFDDQEAGYVARAALARTLPADKVPQQYKDIEAKLQTEDRFRTLAEETQKAQRELAEYKAQVQHEQARAQYFDQTRTYLAGAETEAPHLARLYKADANKALERITAIVQADAQSKLQAHARGELKTVEPMTPAEAARIVESDLASLVSHIVAVPVSQPQTSTPAPKNAKPSLSNRATAPAPVRAAQSDPDDYSSAVDEWLRTNNLTR